MFISHCIYWTFLVTLFSHKPWKHWQIQLGICISIYVYKSHINNLFNSKSFFLQALKYIPYVLKVLMVGILVCGLWVFWRCYVKYLWTSYIHMRVRLYKSISYNVHCTVNIYRIHSLVEYINIYFIHIKMYYPLSLFLTIKFKFIFM